MTTLTDLVTGLVTGAIEAVDLTAPLSETTPIIVLPADHGQPWPFAREAISNFDAAGPTVYWNNCGCPSTPEPTSTRPCTGCPGATVRTFRRSRRAV